MILRVEDHADGKDAMDGAMPGGSFAQPVRQGDRVSRNLGTGATNVHALLRHLEAKGFPHSPRSLGVNGDRTREYVSFIEGETAYPPFRPSIRDEKTLANAAAVIREMHDATTGFAAPDPDGWHTHEIALPVDVDCIGHRDLGPWNFIFRGTGVVGIIDWDFAGPTSRAWDLSYAAHHFVPFHPTDDLAGWGWDLEPDRARRLRILTEAYGGQMAPADLVDLAIVRMTSIAAHIEAEIRHGNPAFEPHRTGDHASGYRKAARHIMENRRGLLAG